VNPLNSADPESRLEARPWRGLAGLSALAPAWDALAREAALDPLCNSHAGTEAYARAFVDERDVLGWTFEERGEPAALLALRREPARGRLALRRAVFAADGTFDSDYLEPPIRPGLERAVAHALFDAARGARGIEALVFAGMPERSRFLAALRDELATRGLPRREHAVACLAAPLPATFESHLARLKPRMRSKVRSAIRAAEQRGAHLAWCRHEDELEPWLEELFRLHELRWQATGRSGSFAEPRRRAFYRSFARAALARGELCFARLEEGEGGAVSATQLGVRAGERYYQIQEGFDPAREDLRVGTALRALALSELIEHGVRAYDFMAGDSRHKRDWGGEPRPCTTIAFPLPRWRARLAYGLRERVERWRPRKTSAAEESAAESD
jgi:CelD/BcsL family acetyltransferase involved in cellulose biosynthesis